MCDSEFIGYKKIELNKLSIFFLSLSLSLALYLVSLASLFLVSLSLSLSLSLSFVYDCLYMLCSLFTAPLVLYMVISLIS